MTYPPQPSGGGFSQPSAPNMGDKFEAHEHRGHLILVYPKNFQENVKTTKGLSDAADVDVIVVDKVGPDGRPMAFHGARLFGNLARSVRNDIGGQVLGRLNQITSANGNTPWILENFTPQDEQAALPVDQAYRQGHFAPTQNPMAPAPATQPAPPAYSGAPSPAPAAPQQQWTPAPQAAPAPAPQAPPTAQQWAPPPAAAPAATPPPQQYGAPAAAATPPAPPAAEIDPNLLNFLASKGINGPFPDQATAEAIARQLPQ